MRDSGCHSSRCISMVVVEVVVEVVVVEDDETATVPTNLGVSSLIGLLCMDKTWRTWATSLDTKSEDVSFAVPGFACCAAMGRFGPGGAVCRAGQGSPVVRVVRLGLPVGGGFSCVHLACVDVAVSNVCMCACQCVCVCLLWPHDARNRATINFSESERASSSSISHHPTRHRHRHPPLCTHPTVQ